MLFVDNKAIQEYDATSEQGIADVEEAILVVRQDEVAHKSEEHVSEDNHSHRLLERAFEELSDSQDNCLQTWHSLLRVLEERDGADVYNDGVQEHADLIEHEQIRELRVVVGGKDLSQLLGGISVVDILQDLPEVDHDDHCEVNFLKDRAVYQNVLQALFVFFWS